MTESVLNLTDLINAFGKAAGHRHQWTRRHRRYERPRRWLNVVGRGPDVPQVPVIPSPTEPGQWQVNGPPPGPTAPGEFLQPAGPAPAAPAAVPTP